MIEGSTGTSTRSSGSVAAAGLPRHSADKPRCPCLCSFWHYSLLMGAAVRLTICKGLAPAAGSKGWMCGFWVGVW